jgi:hypothetical protein
MANIGKAAQRPADAADDDVTDLTGASAGQAMDSTPMDSTPGVSRKRHSTGPSLEMPPCSDCRCPLSGPGAVPYAVLSCGCSDRFGSCAGATFLQTLSEPEFVGGQDIYCDDRSFIVLTETKFRLFLSFFFRSAFCGDCLFLQTLYHD